MRQLINKKKNVKRKMEVISILIALLVMYVPFILHQTLNWVNLEFMVLYTSTVITTITAFFEENDLLGLLAILNIIVIALIFIL